MRAELCRDNKGADFAETLRAIASGVIESFPCGTRLDDLLADFRSELAMKPFLPETGEADIRHALSDAILATQARNDPVKSGRVVRLVNSAGKLSEIEVDASLHAKQMFREIESWDEDAALGFGIRSLDESFGGFYPGEVMALVGAPGSMKTSLALNMWQAFESKFPALRCAFFSLDMPTRQMYMRLLQREADDFKGSLITRINRRDPAVREMSGRMQKRLRSRLSMIGQNKDGHDLTWGDMRESLRVLCRVLGLIF